MDCIEDSENNSEKWTLPAKEAIGRSQTDRGSTPRPIFSVFPSSRMRLPLPAFVSRAEAGGIYDYRAIFVSIFKGSEKYPLTLEKFPTVTCAFREITVASHYRIAKLPNLILR